MSYVFLVIETEVLTSNLDSLAKTIT